MPLLVGLFWKNRIRRTRKGRKKDREREGEEERERERGEGRGAVCVVCRRCKKHSQVLNCIAAGCTFVSGRITETVGTDECYESTYVG
jgi:hypothetical protein